MAPPLAPPAKATAGARGDSARAWAVACGTILFLLGSAFGLGWWLFADQGTYSDAMQEILAIIYASRVVWNLPPGIREGIMPEHMAATETLTYQLLGMWLAIIPVASAGAFWLALRERRRGRQMGVWGDGFVANLIVFGLGTVLLGMEEVAAQRFSGVSDPLHRHLLWAPALVLALPYAVLMLLVLALACSGAGTLLAALFARWRSASPQPKASYRLIFLVALVCVAAVVCQAAIVQTLIAPQPGDATTVIWYPLAAVIIAALAAAATRGPTP
jgi:cytochrome bd-type quinol oxidase subunit 2